MVLVCLHYTNHRSRGSLILAALGTVLVTATMYITYSKVIEVLGIVALIGSATLGWRAVKPRD